MDTVLLFKCKEYESALSSCTLSPDRANRERASWLVVVPRGGAHVHCPVVNLYLQVVVFVGLDRRRRLKNQRVILPNIPHAAGDQAVNIVTGSKHPPACLRRENLHRQVPGIGLFAGF